MRADDRIEAFASWLERHGTRDQRASYVPSVIQGFIAVAGGARVTGDHVERSVRFAREAGIAGVAAMEQLGALFLRFEAHRAGEVADAADAAPPTPTADVAPPAPTATDTSLADEPVDPAPEPELPAAGMSITIRAATQPGGEPLPVKTSRRRTVALLAGLGVVGAAAVVAKGRLGSSDADAPRGSRALAPAATPRLQLRELRLSAEFPSGWREATAAELGPLPAAGSAVATALVFRGARADDPDEAAYFASMPVGRALAGEPTDDSLIEAARTAERGVIAQLDAELGAYRSASCEAVTVGGHRAGTCLGVAARRDAQTQLRTYVRVVGDRQVVALFIAARGTPGAAEVPSSVVGSLAP